MKRIPSLLLGGVVAGVLIFGVGTASPESTEGSSEIEQLKNEVALLRQRVEALEERLPDRSIIIPRHNGRQGPIVIEPPSPTRKDWRPFEFNGMQFYVVPIDSSQTSPAPEP